jgi:hypothetical protein
MKYIHSSETLNIPEGGECDYFPESPKIQREALSEIYDDLHFERAHCSIILQKEQLLTSFSQIVKVTIKSRLVTVEGPRGTHRMGETYVWRMF